MGLQGKGFWIWKIINCEGGSVSAIVDRAVSANLTHVMVKIADGVGSSNVDTTTGQDRVAPLVLALRAKGIQVWGWHYVYGFDPLGEARKAISRLQALNLDGYIVDAEGEFKQSGKDIAATKFMNELRAAYPNLTIALSSYRYPSYHPNFPWKNFLEKCDLNMPQVYWEQAHNPGTQLNRSVNEFKAMTPYRPVIPTGPTYKNNGWLPTEADIKEFMTTAINLGLKAANFFSWDECRRDLPNLWTTIQDFNWSNPSANKDIMLQYVDALNSKDPNRVALLYNSNAVHVTSARTVQGTQAIKAWNSSLMTQLLPNASYTLTSSSTAGYIRNFTWQATSSAGKVLNGKDTMGISAGKISYHYSNFTITH